MQCRRGIHCPEGSIAEQNLGDLVDSKLNMSQQHALAAKNRLTVMPGSISKRTAS